jgi:biotin carboxylase
MIDPAVARAHPSAALPRARLLLVFPASSYRVEAFLQAAERAGVDLWLGTDLPAAFARHGRPTLAVDLRAPEEAATAIVRAAYDTPFAGILATNESSAVVAALAAARLKLPFAAPEGAAAARDKRRMREMFAAAGVPSPRHRVLGAEASPEALAREVSFPCVVKPPMLTGSQGVIRADGPEDLERAVARVRRILARHPSEARADPGFFELVVEDYLPGREVAVEALMTEGAMTPLAIFDKPDDLEGPFFEETIYVTPSRLSPAETADILDVTARAARALGLGHGPVHAELRTSGGRASVVEVAARSIGGLCSQVFRLAAGPLEDLLIAHAAGLPLPSPARAAAAAGVMMMPIPQSGVLRAVTGLDEAGAVPGIEGVTVSLRPGDAIRALPEGASYLGFIFASGPTPAAVEAALRAAHAKLRFSWSPLLATW